MNVRDAVKASALPRWRPKRSTVKHSVWLAWDFRRGEPLLDNKGFVVTFKKEHDCLLKCDWLNKLHYVNPTKERA